MRAVNAIFALYQAVEHIQKMFAKRIAVFVKAYQT